MFIGVSYAFNPKQNRLLEEIFKNKTKFVVPETNSELVLINKTFSNFTRNFNDLKEGVSLETQKPILSHVIYFVLCIAFLLILMSLALGLALRHTSRWTQISSFLFPLNSIWRRGRDIILAPEDKSSEGEDELVKLLKKYNPESHGSNHTLKSPVVNNLWTTLLDRNCFKRRNFNNLLENKWLDPNFHMDHTESSTQCQICMNTESANVEPLINNSESLSLTSLSTFSKLDSCRSLSPLKIHQLTSDNSQEEFTAPPFKQTKRYAYRIVSKAQVLTRGFPEELTDEVLSESTFNPREAKGSRFFVNNTQELLMITLEKELPKITDDQLPSSKPVEILEVVLPDDLPYISSSDSEIVPDNIPLPTVARSPQSQIRIAQESFVKSSYIHSSFGSCPLEHTVLHSNIEDDELSLVDLEDHFPDTSPSLFDHVRDMLTVVFRKPFWNSPVELKCQE